MPATNTSTVAILNLFTTEKYFSKFEVECWDNSLSTLLDSALTDGKWDAATSKFKQIDALYFNGLTSGTTYQFRSRVLPQGGGTAGSWSSFASEVAGDGTPPSVTYASSATYPRQTAAGVLFQVALTTADTDINHVEICCKLVVTGASAPSAPASTDLPTEADVYVTGGVVTFSKQFGNDQTVYVWLRALDTNGNAQAWTALGSGFFSTGQTVADGVNRAITSLDASGNIKTTVTVVGKRLLSDISDLVNGAQGQNLLENPGFEIVSNAGSTTDDTPFLGWQVSGNNLCTVQRDTVNQYVGTSCLYLHQIENTSVPAGTSKVCAIQNSNSITAKPNQWYVFRGFSRFDFATPNPAGLTAQLFATVRCFDGANTQLSETSTNALVIADAGVWRQVSCTVHTPANTAYVKVLCWTISSNPTGGALSTSASFPCDARFDALEFIKATDATSDELTKRGSTPPAFSGNLTYSSTTTSIAWSWNIDVLRTDSALSSQNITGSQTITGLTLGTTYYFYPFMDESTLTLSMVATSGVGTPSWAHTTTSRLYTQEQSRQDHVPLSISPIIAPTTASGTAPGSGGGDGSCLLEGTLVKEKTRGVIRCETVRKGDYLWSQKDTWVLVLRDARLKEHNSWIALNFDCGQALVATSGHPWTLRDDPYKRSYNISLSDLFFCTTGITHPVRLELQKGTRNKVAIECEFPHTFWAATLPELPWVLTHNISPT